MPLGTFTPRTSALERKAEDLTRGDIAPQIRESMLAVVRHASSNAPRSLQREIGPSEIGHPCNRNIAHKLAGTPADRADPGDPWPSVVGTAVHAWMEGALARANQTIGAERWHSEKVVTVADGILAGCGTKDHLVGHCDCYDSWLYTVVDIKVMGNTQHAEYVRGYVSEQYRTQAHCYGLGYVNAGYRVDHVALAIFGRAKRLDDLFVWSEPWDRGVAERALDRLSKIRTVVSAGLDPNQLSANPTDSGCYYCQWRPSCKEGNK